MARSPRAYLATIVILSTAAVLAVGLAVGGSLYLSIYEARQNAQRLCNAYAYFIHRPVPPITTPAQKAQQASYVKLLQFEAKLGCHP